MKKVKVWGICSDCLRYQCCPDSVKVEGRGTWCTDFKPVLPPPPPSMKKPKKQYRPCYVSTDPIKRMRKALFHCWENKEIPLAKFDGLASSEVIQETIEVIQETMDKIHKLKAIPPLVEVIMQKAIVGIVEFEDGTVAEVNPKDIKFVPQDFSEYDF